MLAIIWSAGTGFKFIRKGI